METHHTAETYVSIFRGLPHTTGYAGGLDYSGGTGEPNDPYLIYTAEHLNVLGAEPNDYDKHFKLMADIDLSGYVYDRAVIAPDVNDFESGFQGASFVGVFDGNGHVISHLTIRGDSYLALFGELGWGLSEITNLGLEAVDVNGTGDYIGGLAGDNFGGYSIRSCYSTGIVSGNSCVGGLVGRNGNVDPLGYFWGIPGGTVTGSYSTGAVKGDSSVGGLVGANYGTVQNCYSLAVVTGDTAIGGLVGVNGYWYWDWECERWGIPSDDCLDIAIPGTISNSYSIGAVVGTGNAGGLVGSHAFGDTTNSFWDIQMSGQAESYWKSACKRDPPRRRIWTHLRRTISPCVVASRGHFCACLFFWTDSRKR